MDKPFKSFDEQIEILKSRGLIIDDSARSVLAREGYYPVINGYKDIFLDRDIMRVSGGADHYIRDVSFDNIYRLFLFDRELRMVMFRYFAIAEASLKTACSYVFAEKYRDSKEAYLNKGFYCTGDKDKAFHVGKLIEAFERILGKNARGEFNSKKEYIDHYIKHHDEVPIWVLMNYLTLGQVFKFYDFQNASTKNAIAKYFLDLFAATHSSKESISPRRLRLTYDHIKDFRNICAHGERLYCARVSPAKDISIANVMDDLGLVLPKEENQRMVSEVTKLVIGVLTDINKGEAIGILDAMGIESIEQTFGVIRD